MYDYEQKTEGDRLARQHGKQARTSAESNGTVHSLTPERSIGAGEIPGKANEERMTSPTMTTCT